MSGVVKGDMIIPGSWGLVPPREVYEVVAGDGPDEAHIRLGDNSYLMADSAEAATIFAQRALDDMHRFLTLKRWFETREERAREEVLQEFNADTEGTPLPLDVLVDSLVDEICRLRESEKQ